MKKLIIIKWGIFVLALALFGLIYLLTNDSDYEEIGAYSVVVLMFIVIIPILIIENKQKKLKKLELEQEANELYEKCVKLITERCRFNEAYEIMYCILNKEHLELANLIEENNLEITFDYFEEEDTVSLCLHNDNYYFDIESSNQMLLNSEEMSNDPKLVNEDQLVELAGWKFEDIIDIIIKDIKEIK